jgi:queuine/archaeosine tRNA-ribosyltransferase
VKVSAVDLGGNLDIKKFVREYGIRPPASWEDPIEFERSGRRVFLYSFGAMVGIDVNTSELIRIAEGFLKFIDGGGNLGDVEEVEPEEDVGISPETEEDLMMISFALAQSVSMSRMEGKMDDIEEEVEKVLFQKKISGRKALKVAKELMRVKHELISDIMILERPSITWEIEDLERVYEKVSKYLELGRRYRILEKRLESSFEAVQVLLGIYAGWRETLLELLIIILIAAEVALWIFELI